jgi:hypothetical protein
MLPVERKLSRAVVEAWDRPRLCRRVAGVAVPGLELTSVLVRVTGAASGFGAAIQTRLPRTGCAMAIVASRHCVLPAQGVPGPGLVVERANVEGRATRLVAVRTVVLRLAPGELLAVRVLVAVGAPARRARELARSGGIGLVTGDACDGVVCPLERKDGVILLPKERRAEPDLVVALGAGLLELTSVHIVVA